MGAKSKRLSQVVSRVPGSTAVAASPSPSPDFTSFFIYSLFFSLFCYRTPTDVGHFLILFCGMTVLQPIVNLCVGEYMQVKAEAAPPPPPAPLTDCLVTDPISLSSGLVSLAWLTGEGRGDLPGTCWL